MVWTDDATAIATCVTAVGVVSGATGAFWAVRQVKEVERSRHIATALEISLRWGAPDLVDSRARFWALARDGELQKEFMEAWRTQSASYYAISRLMDFFEDLALLEDMSGISLDWVRRSMGPTVIQYWKTWQYTADTLRKEEPEAYVYFEALARKVQDPGSHQKRWVDTLYYPRGRDL
jgi:hypothetical protein